LNHKLISMKAGIFFLLISLFVLGERLSAQQNNRNVLINSDILSKLKNSKGNFRTLELSFDEGIEDNYYKHLIYNKKHPDVMGYRIKIFSGSGHDAMERASKARARFLKNYEDVNAYLQYDAPDYKVYVGDCRTRSEVLKLFFEVKKEFPYAFPIPQAIKVMRD
jgi:hypothetical protein